jgi:hypothetical protein
VLKGNLCLDADARHHWKRGRVHNIGEAARHTKWEWGGGMLELVLVYLQHTPYLIYYIIFYFKRHFVNSAVHSVI